MLSFDQRRCVAQDSIDVGVNSLKKTQLNRGFLNLYFDVTD
jgi:hypothetical protein